MKRYRKKPVVIEAIQFTGTNWGEIHRWIRDMADISTVIDGIAIKTLEGRMVADVGDWIIRGLKGEFYPCKPDIFDATYEPVDEEGR